MSDTRHRPFERSAALLATLALLVWLLPGDLTLAWSALERLCTMSCGDAASCCCKASSGAGQRSGWGLPRADALAEEGCRPDCAPVTLVTSSCSQALIVCDGCLAGDGRVRRPVPMHAEVVWTDAPLTRFASRAPPTSLVVA